MCSERSRHLLGTAQVGSGGDRVSSDARGTGFHHPRRQELFFSPLCITLHPLYESALSISPVPLVLRNHQWLPISHLRHTLCILMKKLKEVRNLSPGVGLGVGQWLAVWCDQVDLTPSLLHHASFHSAVNDSSAQFLRPTIVFLTLCI